MSVSALFGAALDIDDDRCAYLLEAGKRRRCGASRRPDSAYCPTHHELCYLAPGSNAERRERRHIARLAARGAKLVIGNNPPPIAKNLSEKLANGKSARGAGADRAAASASETLILISAQNVDSGNFVLLQTIWATTTDLQRGHRRTDIERFTTTAALLIRLNELAPQLIRRATADLVGDNSQTVKTVQLAAVNG